MALKANQINFFKQLSIINGVTDPHDSYALLILIPSSSVLEILPREISDSRKQHDRSTYIDQNKTNFDDFSQYGYQIWAYI